MSDNETWDAYKREAESVKAGTQSFDDALDRTHDETTGGDPAESDIKKELLDRLLSAVNPVDFIKVCKSLGWVGQEDSNGNVKPPLQKHYKVAIIDQLLRLARKKNWHIARDAGYSYIYDGARWIPLDRAEFEDFLKNAAIRQDYPVIESRDSGFVSKLYDQAICDSFFSKKYSQRRSMINLKNGTLVLTSEQVFLKDFDYRDFLTHKLQFDHDESAENGLFLDYLDRVIPSADTQLTIQQAAGYLFIKGLKLEVITFLFGTGANGKSVFAEVLKGVLGDGNISHYSLESLTDDHGYYRAKIKDKIVNYGTDIKMKRVDIGKFKTLASGEPIEARHPYGQPFIIENYAKLIFNVNTFSDVRIERTQGFRRRLIVIPFGVRIPDAEQDKRLHEKILKDKAGVLNWIISGAKEVIRTERIYISDECEKLKAKLLKNADTVAMFIDECGYGKSEGGGAIALGELYKEYREYCAASGNVPLGRNNFSEAMINLGYERHKDGKSRVILFNVWRHRRD